MIKLISGCVQISILSLLLTACSEEAKPYEEINSSIENVQDRGHIQTH